MSGLHSIKAGSYRYEPAGSIHTLHVPGTNEEVTDVWFAIRGANLKLDADGNVESVLDAGFVLETFQHLRALFSYETQRTKKAKKELRMKVRLNAKYVVFSVIAIMMGYVLYHNERFLIEPTNPIWEHYAPFKWWLLPHGIFGAIVILLAPLQFSDRLRRRYTRLHRIVGRLFVTGAFVLAPLGAYIQYYEERLGLPRSFTVLAVVNAVMLIGATALAFLFAYRRKITQHRQWVTRSYAIALVFIEGRFIMGVTGWEQLGVEIVQAIIWSCLAMSVLVGDVAIHWTEIRVALSAPARSSVPTKQNVQDVAAEAT